MARRQENWRTLFVTALPLPRHIRHLTYIRTVAVLVIYARNMTLGLPTACAALTRSSCQATIDGDTVVVQAKEVATPAQVRFGWHNEANPNLVNQACLPASSFQTRNWQGGTGE